MIGLLSNWHPSAPKPQQRAAARQTLLDAVARWGASHCNSPFTFHRYSSAARSLVHFGIKGPEHVTVAKLAEYVEFRRSSVAAVTVNVDLAALATLLRFMGHDGLADTAMARRVPEKRGRRLNARHLSFEEVQHLARTARTVRENPVYELAIWVDAFLGLRLRELARVRWCDFDLGAHPTLHVKIVEELGMNGRIKTNQERVVPVCRELKELLMKRREDLGRDFLFKPTEPRACRGAGRSSYAFLRPQTLELAMIETVEASGLKDVSWTTLRHTRASWWVQAGVPLAKVAKWLGNTLNVCERYYAGVRDGYDPDCERMPGAPRS